MKSIVTVLGKDKVGITAKVCILLSERNINILDISQTITGGYFNMMMIVDISGITTSFDETVEALNKLGLEIGVVIRMQHEDIFNTMHRI